MTTSNRKGHSPSGRSASQFTPALRRALVALLGPKRRWTVYEAAETVGLTRAVVWAWIRAGRKGHPTYRAIAEAFDAGRCCQACGAVIAPRRSGGRRRDAPASRSRN